MRQDRTIVARLFSSFQDHSKSKETSGRGDWLTPSLSLSNLQEKLCIEVALVQVLTGRKKLSL